MSSDETRLKEVKKTALQTRFQQQQQLRKQLRTNQTSVDSLQHFHGMNRHLQNQVIQQLRGKREEINETIVKRANENKASVNRANENGASVNRANANENRANANANRANANANRANANEHIARVKGKPKSRNKKPKSNDEVTSLSVDQSTSDTHQSIAKAKHQILLTALEKQFEQTIEPDQMMYVQQGLSIFQQIMTQDKHLADEIKQQLLQWSQQTPDQETILKYAVQLSETIRKKLAENEPSERSQPTLPTQHVFNHEPNPKQ